MSNVIALPDRSSARTRVAAAVRAEIARAGINVLEMSKATEIPQSTLYRKVKPKSPRDAFDVDELERIAYVLNVPITRFFAAPEDHQGPSGGGQTRETNPGPIHYE